MKRYLQFFIICLFYVFIPLSLHAELITASDTVFSDETWTADTVQVIGNIIIPDGVTLTIEPGTRIEFTDHYGIEVMGTLLADGTETDTIVFTVSDTAGYYVWDDPGGSWWGIIFNNHLYFAKGKWHGADGSMVDNDTSRIDHCRIEFTKGLPTAVFANGAIESASFSRLIVSNCEILNNRCDSRGGGIRAYTNSDIIIRNNYIHHNSAWQWGGGIYLHNSGAIVEGNTIEDNRTLAPTTGGWAAGGGIGVLGMNPLIRNNIIRNNSAIVGSGIYMHNSFGLVKDNTITYNTGYNNPPNNYSQGGGIACKKGSSPRIVNNFIANNTADEGGGIFDWESESGIYGNLIVNNTGVQTSGGIASYLSSDKIINNTIANNDASTAGAVEIWDSDPVFMNNIIWNNTGDPGGQIKLLGYFAELHVKSCVIQGGASSIYGEGTPEITKLIPANPRFVTASGGTGAGSDGLSGTDWSVRNTSVCINNGNMNALNQPIPNKDLAGGKRIQHSIIDIGGYEAYIPFVTAGDTIKTNITWQADTVKVTGNLVVDDDVTLTVLPGTVVKFMGRYKLTVNGTIKAAGTAMNPIHFIVADTAGNYNKSIPDGSWLGIFIDNEAIDNAMADNNNSVLSYCNIGFVKSLDGEAFMHSALYVNHFSGLTLKNCTFFENSAHNEPASLFLRLADIDVIDCRFINNRANEGPAIWAENSVFTIDKCEFMDNQAGNIGGAVRTSGGELTLSNSVFMNNSSGNNGGALFLQRTLALVHHSQFINNYSGNRGGSIFAQFENFQLVNNLIANNTGRTGGGVYSNYADDILTLNNTICNNYAENGGGMYTAFANHTSINDIMSGNDVLYDGKQYGIYSVTATIKFRNTLLEGGTEEIGFWVGQDLTGKYTNIIDSLPQFIRPSDGPGNDFDGTASNWNLKSISPCINNGTLSGAALLLDKDLRGNPRVFDSIVDIGAVESQYGLPEIRNQPDNYIGCAGDNVEFKIGTRFESYFQWRKDGMDIPGATGNTMLIENISTEDDGSYRCIVSNAFGSIESSPVYLLARSAPEFVRQPENKWAVEGNRTIISSTAIGTTPIHVQWYKDGVELPGKTWPDLWINNTGPSSEGRYHCIARNACQEVSSDTIQVYLAPQICMVTVDTADGNNLVIWEKNSTAPIASYNIYRESIVAGQYDVIGNVGANALSEYTDTEVNPISQAYIYKITAVMGNEEESDIDLCKPHKTMHLLTSRNLEYDVAQLDWDYYYGFDYGTFYIYRFDSTGTLFDTIAKSSSTTTWLDEFALPGEAIFYRIAVQRSALCIPTGNGKAGTGPYTHALSNLDDNKLKATGIGDILAGQLKIYPNPFSDRTTVEISNPEMEEYRIMVRDLAGKTVLIDRFSTESYIIERGNLAAGIYAIELVGKKIYRDRFMIK